MWILNHITRTKGNKRGICFQCICKIPICDWCELQLNNVNSFALSRNIHKGKKMKVLFAFWPIKKLTLSLVILIQLHITAWDLKKINKDYQYMIYDSIAMLYVCAEIKSVQKLTFSVRLSLPWTNMSPWCTKMNPQGQNQGWIPKNTKQNIKFQVPIFNLLDYLFLQHCINYTWMFLGGNNHKKTTR